MSEQLPEKSQKQQKSYGDRAEDELGRARKLMKAEGGDPQLAEFHLQQAKVFALLEVADQLRKGQ